MFRSHLNPKDMDVKESFYKYCYIKKGEWMNLMSKFEVVESTTP
jgi:hypothetical protein